MWRYSLRRRIHISWLIACLSGGVVIGVWAAQYLMPGSVLVWVLLPVGMVVAGFGLWRRRMWFVLLVILGGMCVGVWRGSLLAGELQQFQQFHGSELMLSGVVADDPSIGRGGQINIQLGQIVIDNQALAGKVWVTSGEERNIKRSDRLTVKGTLQPGFGTYAAVMYRATILEWSRSEFADPGATARDWFSGQVRAVVEEPQASLGLGFLTGQKSALPSDLSDALRIAGLTHIVVASGYNLTILVRLARRIFMRVSKFVSMFASSLMIAGFMMVTGLSPSMSRAGLVAGLSLAAWYYGRRFHPMVLLPLAAAVTVMVQPSYVWGDVGWQLSFAAFAGVMILAPLLQRFFFGDKKPGTIRQILGETVAAHIATLPIIVLTYGLISNVAIPANILVVPLVPLAMLVTFITGIMSATLQVIAPVIALPTQWLLGYMIEVSSYLAELPWAQTEVQLPTWLAVLSYFVIIAICYGLWRATRHDLRSDNLIE